ncbi:hypothetical protein [Caldilinea sp.]|uniref:hypothetical protein n=1 Tax=Caldilinea sp. TaxID=2293560 RepID=UPI002C7D3ED8|nr:hypothetical protein [Caldilinea sp.]
MAIVRLQKEVNALSERLSSRAAPRENWLSGTAGCGGFLAVAGIIGLLAGGASYFGSGLLSILVGAGLVFIGLRLFGESNEEKQLSKAIIEKQAEIARHQQIVKS